MKCTCEAVKELDDRDGCPVHDVEPQEWFSSYVPGTCEYCGNTGHNRLGCPNRTLSSFLP